MVYYGHMSVLMENRSDDELIKLIGRKDREALKMLYQRYQVKIFNFILKITGNRGIAQELIQETFVKVWFAAHTFDEKKGSSKTWLHAIALNLTRNEMRKKEYSLRFINPEDIREQQPRLVAGSDPEKELELEQLNNQINVMLGNLKPFLREVVILKNFEGLKFREIAEVMQIPESTLKARYLRAIEILKKNMTEPGGKDYVRNE